MLKNLKDLIEELRKTNSMTKKQDILKSHSNAISGLLATYHPLKNYYISSIKCKEHGKFEKTAHTPEKVLDLLSTRQITGHRAMEIANGVAKNLPQDLVDVWWLIIDRDIKCGIGASLINKIFPNTIPEFKVALANKYDEKTSKKVTFDGKYYVSKKLDGCRIITIVSNGSATCYSRAGNEIPQAKKIADDAVVACEKAGISEIVLDGELCTLNSDGTENFQEVVGLIHRKNYIIENPKYYIFDAITLEGFWGGVESIPLTKRYIRLNGIIDAARDLKLKTIVKLDQDIVMSEDQFNKMIEYASDNNWEGLMLRKADSIYEGKRTNNLLKVKTFIDAEYVVKSVEMGPIRVIDPVTKLAKDEVMLSSVTIQHKGNDVSVGSGFSIEQRREYYKNKTNIIGKQITVKYFQESQDKNGKFSLRFPTVKHVWDKNRDC